MLLSYPATVLFEWGRGEVDSDYPFISYFLPLYVNTNVCL